MTLSSIAAWIAGPVLVIGAVYFLAVVWDAIFPPKPDHENERGEQ